MRRASRGQRQDFATASWRRAVWLTLGLGPDELLAAWEEENVLAERYRRVLLRG